eukprot:9323290-Pyramimonas_sp.AAC.1
MRSPLRASGRCWSQDTHQRRCSGKDNFEAVVGICPGCALPRQRTGRVLLLRGWGLRSAPGTSRNIILGMLFIRRVANVLNTAARAIFKSRGSSDWGESRAGLIRPCKILQNPQP